MIQLKTVLRKFALCNLLLLFSVSPAFALADFSSAAVTTPGTTKTLNLPPNADNSPIISLGSAIDPQSGEIVEGYAIVHPKDNKSKPSNLSGNATLSTCYGYLAKGAKWKTVEPYIMNPANTRGLNQSALLNTENASVNKWEDAADGILGNGLGVNVIGTGTQTSAMLAADTSAPDGQNEVYFAPISDSSTIAVTIVWGIFGGPTFQRKLVEWDQVYDDVKFDWSLTGEVGKMDFENLAVHELGHSFGMNDLYTSSCSEETMFGYASTGETKKRTLNSGDILGINNLY